MLAAGEPIGGAGKEGQPIRSRHSDALFLNQILKFPLKASEGFLGGDAPCYGGGESRVRNSNSPQKNR